MPSGGDIKRAFILKRLFEQQLAKVDHAKSYKERMCDAARLMDELVGPEWRGEVEIPELDIIAVVDGGSPSADPDSFYFKLHKTMRNADLDMDEIEPLDTAEHKQKRQSLMDAILAWFATNKS